MQEKRSLPSAVFILLIITPIGLRWLFPERGMDSVGPRALLDSLFAVWLCLVIFLLAHALGKKSLARLLKELPAHEQTLFAIPFGLGAMAYGVLALGLLGILTPASIAMGLLALLLFTWGECQRTVESLPAMWRKFRQAFPALQIWQKAVLILAALIFLATLSHALAPLWDYDGLMYHLQGPRLFLENQRIYFVREIFQANGPFTIEMLFTIGLAFGSTSVAKLIHLGYLILFFAAAYSFAKRHLGSDTAWLTVLVLLGVPFLLVDASYANIDFGLATYEFLALYALTIALTDSASRPRVDLRLPLLSGLLIGFALGTKYLALGTAGLLGLWWLWNARARPVRQILSVAAAFGLSALFVASPWYIKNFIFTGNPVYPFYFDSPGWDESRRGLLMYYVNSFGVGKDWLNTLLLPLNMILKFKFFGTVFFEMPSTLFPAALLFPLSYWRTDPSERNKTLPAIFIFTALYFALWASGSQQTRFFLPIFPLLAMFAALALKPLINSYAGRLALTGLIGGTLAATLFVQYSYLTQIKPLPPLVGLESKRAFLQRTLPDFNGVMFLQSVLQAGERALWLWDGQTYYCGEQCIPDTGDLPALALTSVSESDSGTRSDLVTARLRQMGADYVFLNKGGLGWYVEYHDPQGLQLEVARFLYHEYFPSCSDKIYEDDEVAIYRVTCR